LEEAEKGQKEAEKEKKELDRQYAEVVTKLKLLGD
jgi:hypothetical protein